MLDQQLCIEIAKELKYVYAQAPGDKLTAWIKDGEMVGVYLSAKALRQIALLVKETARIER